MRAAAVSALAKFGTKCEDLRPSIVTLLSRCKYDADDEVRDRATMYLDLLTKDATVAKKLVLDGMRAFLRVLFSDMVKSSRETSENHKVGRHRSRMLCVSKL